MERADLSKIFVELYVYTGTLTTDKPSTYDARLVSDAVVQTNGNYRAQVDISEFARDLVDVSYTGSTASAAVWIEYDLYYADTGDTSLTLEGSYSLTGLDGGGYFEDGYNWTGSNRVLMSSDYVIVPRGGGVEIPVLQDDLTQFLLARFSVVLHNSGPLSTTENTANVVYYGNTNLADNADRAIFKFSSGSDREINIRYVDECLNENIRVTFVNKYGAIQDLYFFGKNAKLLTTSNTTYKRNLLSGGTYNTKKHQNSILSKNGVNSFTLNSGFYPEDANGTFEELLLSEQVWITLPSDFVDGVKTDVSDVVYPVNIKTSSLQLKKQVYDDLINYTIDFEIANDKISTVR